MKGKKLSGALSNLLEEPKGKKNHSITDATATNGTGEIRATIIVDKEKMEKLKAIAFHHKVLIKDIVDSAFDKYITAYEKKHGKVEERPEEKKLPI